MLTSLRKIGARCRGPRLLRGASKVVDLNVHKTGDEYRALKALHKERAGNVGAADAARGVLEKVEAAGPGLPERPAALQHPD